MNTTTDDNSQAATGQVERPVRPLIVRAYEECVGAVDGKFTLADLEAGGGYAGWEDFQLGWSAAVEAAIAEAERLCIALDHGGNQYRRPAGADVVAAALRSLRPNDRIQPRR